MPLAFLSVAPTAAADLTLVLVVTAAAGAVAASLARLPSLVGYLVAGAIAGPALLDLVEDPDRTQFAADLGVALLLFVLGVELSLRELYANLFRATAIGLGQIALVGLAGGAGAYALGFPVEAAFVMGAAVSLSSTAAGLVLLGRSGEAGREIAPLAAGILLVQDLVAVVLIAVVPSITGANGTDVATTLFHVALGLVAIAVLVPLASAGANVLLRVVALRVDRELFLVIVVASIGLIAAGTAQAGLSVALGAFVAGLVLSHSGFAAQVLREVEGFATIFAALFFVSAGLLVDPAAVTDEPALLPVLFAVAVPLKAGVLFLLARLSGIGSKPAIVLALVLGNAGEFSFVVAAVAEEGVIGGPEQATIVSLVTLSLIVSSVVVARVLGREGGAETAGEVADVAILGYGRLGRSLAIELRRRGVGFVVVESEPDLARLARTEGFDAIWGDARRRDVCVRACRERVVFVTPRGQTGSELVEAVAEHLPGTRVISVATPSTSAVRAGIDLTSLEIGEPAKRLAADAVEAALARPAEPYTLRAPGGTVRLPPRAKTGGAGGLRRLLARATRPPARGLDRCPACRGTGRRTVAFHSVTCPVCGGTGKRSTASMPGRTAD